MEIKKPHFTLRLDFTGGIKVIFLNISYKKTIYLIRRLFFKIYLAYKNNPLSNPHDFVRPSGLK